jgi:hypothetical protein
MKRGDRVYCQQYGARRRRTGTVREVVTITWDSGECARYAHGTLRLFLLDWSDDSTTHESFAA